MDLRRRPERGLRRAWRHGPGPGLRVAGVLYALAAETRSFLYDAGVLAARRPAVPVVSVGGLTVGGSGKTPVSAAVADALEGDDRRMAVVTHGYADEVAVHRRLEPERIVVGGRDRASAVGRAAARGADAVVVDSGLQRRSLARAAEVVVIGSLDVRARCRLPAGPMREGWSTVGRADAVVLTRRTGAPPFPAGFNGWLGSWVPDAVTARCELRAGDLVPANEAARERETPDPAVAVASVMHPEPFFRALAGRGFAPDLCVRVTDHGRPGRRRLAELVRRAGERGMVGTLKDVVKLEGPVGEATPLWHLRDVATWTSGRTEMIERIERILEETK